MSAARSGEGPPRVLHVVESWPPVPSGYASRSRWIVETQARTGVARPAVLVTSRQGVYDGGAPTPLDGVPVEIVPPSGAERFLRGLRVPALRRPFHVDARALAGRVEAAARAHRADVVHVHWASAIGAAAARAAGRLGLPLVAELRFDLAGAMFAQSAGGRARFAEPPARRWFDRHLGAARVVVVASDALGELVRPRADRTGVPVVSVPNGIDAAFLAACDAAREHERARARAVDADGPDPVPARRVTVGTTSKMLRYEGLETLIDAAAALPDIDLVFVGDGPERDRLETLARPLDAERPGRGALRRAGAGERDPGAARADRRVRGAPAGAVRSRATRARSRSSRRWRRDAAWSPPPSATRARCSRTVAGCSSRRARRTRSSRRCGARPGTDRCASGSARPPGRGRARSTAATSWSRATGRSTRGPSPAGPPVPILQLPGAPPTRP